MSVTTKPPRKNILIVDDKPDNLRLLSAMLTEQGYKVRSVISGTMALIGVRAAPPDLILLDINMPEMNGFEVCERLKADSETQAIPIIFISALDEVLDKVQAFAVGGVDYITKPFQMREVLARVENQLRLQELQHALQNLNAELEDRVQERTSQLAAEVQERREAQARLLHMATHDPLTDLPNRTLFMEQLTASLNTVKNQPAAQFAVLFLDCDRFKLVNDSLGHLLGDQLLLAITDRLQTLCAEQVSLLARLGGDEFTLLLTGIDSANPAIELAEDIQQAFARPFILDEHEIFTSVSIGIALGSAQYDDPSFILRDADTAMYQAKASPTDSYKVFDADMHARVRSRLQLENDLRRALENNEFELVYQPIIALAEQRLQGFEALLRWNHPQQGVVSPLDFIPICEETGLILPLGEWVLNTACQQLQTWCQQTALASALSMSVNFSTRQLTQLHQLPDLIAQVLYKAQLSAQHLKVEITESALMENPNAVAQLLQRLQAQGLSICIDDFGTGYSSLSYLHQFPINQLKIDQTFIGRLDQETESQTIVRVILDLANTLGLTVVAEGIETKTQQQWLVQQGCQLGQGYWFSHPLSSSQALDFIIKTNNN